MISIPEVMFSPARLRKRLFLDELLSTITTEPMQEIDNSMPDAVLNKIINLTISLNIYFAAYEIHVSRW